MNNFSLIFFFQEKNVVYIFHLSIKQHTHIQATIYIPAFFFGGGGGGGIERFSNTQFTLISTGQRYTIINS